MKNKIFEFKVSLGVIKIILTSRGIKALDFYLRKRILVKEGKGKLFNNLKADFKSYFSGQKKKFNYKLDLSCATSFQKKVWQKVNKIPYGKIATYKEIARLINKPLASRAVGQALKKNPLMILIPCHRVINSNGKLGGFSKGLNIKKVLLGLEKVQL